MGQTYEDEREMAQFVVLFSFQPTHHMIPSSEGVCTAAAAARVSVLPSLRHEVDTCIHANADIEFPET